MKPALFILSIVLVVVVVASVALFMHKETQLLAPDKAHQLVKDGAILLDVRSVSEFESGHIEGAINIPVDQLGAKTQTLGDPTKPIVMYCRSGHRSGQAMQILKKKGFTSLYDLGRVSRW